MEPVPSQFALSLPDGSMIFVPWNPSTYHIMADGSKVPVFALATTSTDFIKKGGTTSEPPRKKSKNKREIDMDMDLGFFDDAEHPIKVQFYQSPGEPVVFSFYNVDHIVHFIKLMMFDPERFSAYEKRLKYASPAELMTIGSEIKALAKDLAGFDFQRWDKAIPYIAAIVCFYRFKEELPDILVNPEDVYLFTLKRASKLWDSDDRQEAGATWEHEYPKALALALRWHHHECEDPPLFYSPEFKGFCWEM